VAGKPETGLRREGRQGGAVRQKEVTLVLV
jgi:hypothetical protein